MAEQNTSESHILAQLAQDTLREKKISRRWSLFFRLAGLALLLLFLSNIFRSEKPLSNHVALIRLEGVIGLEQKTADRLIAALDLVEKNKRAKAVIIRANSPGGSPVQSDLAYRAILDFKQRSKIPVHVVVEEMCASGCYYIASAADKIFAAPASIVGSIGVVGSGFGLDQAIKKLGVERRILTSGENKALGDPFLPENPKHIALQKGLMAKVHAQFIAAVEQGRGKVLKKDTPDLYSGRVWLGEEAVSLGMIDGLSNIRQTAKALAPDLELLDMTQEDDLFTRISRVAGTQIASGLMQYWLMSHNTLS